jgi:hypothetical protein
MVMRNHDDLLRIDRLPEIEGLARCLVASLSTPNRPRVEFTEDGFSLPKALMEDWGQTGEIFWEENGIEIVIPVRDGVPVGQ